MTISWHGGPRPAAALICWASLCFSIDLKPERGPSVHNRSTYMETLNFKYEAKKPVARRAHAGVVGSGDLEVLLEPSDKEAAQGRVRTSVDGYAQVWKAVLDRFFARFERAAKVEINDFGATPGTVTLRLEQAAEEVRS